MGLPEERLQIKILALFNLKKIFYALSETERNEIIS